MKRRETLQLLPAAVAGVVGAAVSAVSDPLRYKYPSVDSYRGKYDLSPGSGEPLALRYTKKVRDILLSIRETQSKNLLEASYAIANAVMRKNTCWYRWNMGHGISFEFGRDRNGMPELFTVGYKRGESRDGDVYLKNIRSSPEEVNDLTAKDICVIGSPIPWGSDARNAHFIERDTARHRMRPYADIWLETGIDTVGAIMRVPGMPAPIGPISGVIGMVLFWMMAADTCRILAREGFSLPVRGDDPALTGNNIPWVSLYDPLMDDYFEQVMLQIEMIGAEAGEMRRIAEMAVDAVLAGGNVYCYSRDREALAVEAQTRRGGLAMTRGLFEVDGALKSYNGEWLDTNDGKFIGRDKDLVIMGIFQPDSATDLKYLDKFRKSGMKVASIGPMTRDTVVPEGRTVPKEADVHVGRMCDTNGLYAVPGFERKVCPTSGPLINQIFWATCMEIVEEVIRRTGNVPGVFFSAAIKGGTSHMHKMNNQYRERGY